MSVAMGEGTNFVVNEDGELYAWGLNFDSELCLWFDWTGDSTSLPIHTPTHVRQLQGRIKMVAAEKRHAACVMQSGEVFVWGQPHRVYTHRVIGSSVFLQATGDNKHGPRPVPTSQLGDARAIQVVCSTAATFILTDAGEIFRTTFEQRKYRSRLIRQNHFDVQTVPMGDFFSGHPIKMIATGSETCFAIGRHTGMWSWGSGYAGVLGHGDELDYPHPTLVRQFEHHIVQYVAAGSVHVVAISAGVNGNRQAAASSDSNVGVFAWGLTMNGQLGLRLPTVFQTTPLRMPADMFGHEKIAMVACGDFFTLLLSTEGTLWGVGRLNDSMDNPDFGFEALWPESGIAGESVPMALDGTQPPDLEPPLLRFIPRKYTTSHFANSKVVFITADAARMAAVTEHGLLYKWTNDRAGDDGAPVLFHPENDPSPPMCAGMMSQQQPYFGGQRVCVQHRLSIRNATMYALGHYRDNRQYYAFSQHQRNLLICQRALRERAELAAATAANTAHPQRNAEPISWTTPIDWQRPFDDPSAYMPLSVLHRPR